MTVRFFSMTALLLASLSSVAVAQNTIEGLSVRGQLRPAQAASLSAGVGRQITHISVQAGSDFQEGDVLVRFDCREEGAEKDIKAKLDAARTRQDVNLRLEEFENVSVLAIELSRAELAMTEAELRKIDAILDKCVVRAPFSGSVVEKSAQEYQFVGVGEPLLEIMNPDSLEIEAVLPSTALAWIEKGQILEMDIDETGALVAAQVDRIVREVDPVSQTIRIFGSIDSAGVNLLPGMSGQLRFSSP